MTSSDHVLCTLVGQGFIKEILAENVLWCVNGCDGMLSMYRIRRHADLKWMVSLYCQKEKLSAVDVILLLNGTKISGTDSAASLDMKIGDHIDIYLPEH